MADAIFDTTLGWGVGTLLPVVEQYTPVVEQRHQVYVTGENFGAQVLGVSLLAADGTPYVLDGFQIDGLGKSFRATVPANVPVGVYTLVAEPTTFAVVVRVEVVPPSGALVSTAPGRLPPGTLIPRPTVADLGTIPADLMAYLRSEMADQAESFQSFVEGAGLPAMETRIELEFSPVQASSLQVTLLRGSARTVLVAGTDYTLLDVEGVLTLAQPLGRGDILAISGMAYKWFTDAEYTIFLTTAAQYQTYGKETVSHVWDPAHGVLRTVSTPISFATVPDVQKPALAIAAKIEALNRLLTEAVFEVEIESDGATINRPRRYQQLQQQIAYERQRLDELNSRLNIGLGAYSVETLRRVSIRTGRYVPVIVPREVNDTDFPRQLFPPIGVTPGVDEIVAPFGYGAPLLGGP